MIGLENATRTASPILFKAVQADTGDLADPLADPLATPVEAPAPEASGRSLVQMLLSSSVQMAAGGPPPDDVHRVAASGVSGTGGDLPYMDRIQASFGGHDVSGIRAHTGGAAGEATRALGAQAYATGNDVAFGSSPSLHTAAHEAAHVVQQRGGVQLKGGVGSAGDVYERHADAVADLVVQGKSAEGLLDDYAGSGGSPAVQADGGKVETPKESQKQEAQKPQDGQQKPLPDNALKKAEKEEEGNKGPEFKLAKSDEYAFQISVPVVPGFNVTAEVSVELGKETKLDKGLFNKKDGHEENTKSTMKMSLKIGGEFSVLFFKIAVGLFGTVEVEMPGNKNILDLTKMAATETVRFFSADKAKGVTDRLKKIGEIVEERKRDINGVLNPLQAKVVIASKATEQDRKDILEEVSTDSAWYNPWSTAKEKVEGYRKDFLSDLKGACDLPGEEAEKAANIVIPFSSVQAELGKIAEVLKQEDKNWAQNANKAIATARENIHGMMDGATKQARKSVEQLDFAVPTPGVRVVGDLGGYVKASFTFGSSGAGAGEGEVLGGFRYDTGRTKKEKVDQGDGTFKERDVFDRDKGMQGVLKLRGKLEVAGWGGELELVGAWTKGLQTYQGTLEGWTMPLPIFVQPGDLSGILQTASAISRKVYAPAAEEAKKVEDEDGSRSFLENTLKRMKEFYALVKEPINALVTGGKIGKRGYDVATTGKTSKPGFVDNATNKVKEKLDVKSKESMDVGTSKIMVGGSLKLEFGGGQNKVGGDIRVGTMTENKIELLGLAEASQKSKEYLKLEWDA